MIDTASQEVSVEPILRLQDFVKLPESEQRRLLITWRSTEMTNMDIHKQLGMNTLDYYAMCRKMKLPRKKGRRQIREEYRRGR